MDVRVIVQVWYLIKIARQTLSLNDTDCRKINSTCCYNEYFDKGTGSCVECPPGSIGWNCKRECPKGYYGRLCRSQCPCEAHHCDSVTGCKQSIREYSTGETRFFNDSTVEVRTKQAEQTSVTEKHVQTEVTEKYIRTKLFNLTLTYTTKAGEGVHDENHPDHHDFHQWMAISFLLIGSLVTISVCGILFYLRTTNRCNASSRYPRLDGIDIQQEASVEEPSDRNLPEEVQSNDYDEIRYSQFNDCSTAFRKYNDSACKTDETTACTVGIRKMKNMYDRDDHDSEYSRLQLRKKQSRVINYYGTQKLGYVHQDQKGHVSLKPSDSANSALRKANTLPRNCQSGSGCHEHNTKCTHNIIRSTSESRLFDLQKNVKNGSPKSVTSMDVSGVAREMQRDDTMIDTDERPYSFCKL